LAKIQGPVIPKIPLEINLSVNPTINAESQLEYEGNSTEKSQKSSKDPKNYKLMLKKIKQEEAIRKRKMLAEKKRYQKKEKEELLERQRQRQEQEEERRKKFEELEKSLSKHSK